MDLCISKVLWCVSLADSVEKSLVLRLIESRTKVKSNYSKFFMCRGVFVSMRYRAGISSSGILISVNVSGVIGVEDAHD